MTIKQQQAKDKVWFDEAGTQIPYNRTTMYERNAERSTFKLATEALKIHEQLAAYKERVRKEAEELYKLFCEENGGKIGKGKGNATFYNFDRSIKVEVSISEAITFDENTIQLAKEKLDEVLSDGLNGAKDFVKPLVMEAFQTSNGKLDTKRVLGLRRYTDRVRDNRYSLAMQLIDKAVRRPDSKTYFRVWVRDSNGQYKDIQLNFASI
ncbi:DUF3164 family protein [Olivibacter sp. 47]|uniref:DUF3164 family protein n=1 Tax=Olivibacter sp. 47 TaxID=3056486 RepID=UPI0025A42C13|nr:DUF3164 family protein [Olivibacter sp. 47]MDM8176869.1 DUF3164 family protein [Olivibacter sp. 47]